MNLHQNVLLKQYLNLNQFDKYICYDVFQENVDECLKNTSDLDIDIEVFKKAVFSHSNKQINVYAYVKPHSAPVLDITKQINIINIDTNNLDYFGNSGNIGCVEHTGPQGEGWKKENIIDIVSTISLEEIIDTYGTIQLLKVDVEGSEYEFLLHKDLSKINYITCELHFEYEKIQQLIQHISNTHIAIVSHPPHIFTFKLKELLV